MTHSWAEANAVQTAPASYEWADPTERVLVPVKRRVRLGDNLRSRKIAWVIGVRDIKVKYKQSFLGPVWLLIQPAAMLVGFAVVFKGLAHVNTHGIPYWLFALIGLTVWTYLQTVCTTGANAQVSNRELIRRFTVARVAFSNGSLLGNLPGPGIMLLVTVVGIAISNGLPLQALVLPALIAWVALLSWAVVLTLSAMTARFRDVIGILPFLFQAGVFLSPVAYPLDAAPASIRDVLAFNPTTGLLESWRWALTGSNVATLPLVVSLAGTFLVATVGWLLFARMEVRFADYI